MGQGLALNTKATLFAVQRNCSEQGLEAGMGLQTEVQM